MNRLPYALYLAADVRALERSAMDDYGTPGITLMRRAGAALFEEICRRWPGMRRIVVVCGGGNNGGDGYVVARLANEQGFDVILAALTDPALLKGDARTAWGAAQAEGLMAVPFSPDLLDGADLVVDAIFGIGLDREVAGEFAEVIDAINASAAPVVAVDIPSGLHADTGRVMGRAIAADLTVTFIGVKCGLLTGEGPDCSGEIVCRTLDLPEALYERHPAPLQRIDWARLKENLPPRRRTAHKGDSGHLLIVGGNHGMAGAVRLAAQAALRSGAGLVTVATRPEHVAAMAAACPEVMWRGVEDEIGLQPLLARATVAAIGPGLGQERWSRQLFDALCLSPLPCITDADALNLLAAEPLQNQRWILTPHPGEAARLLGCSVAKINADRSAAARELQRRYGGVVVLKGAGTVVCSSGRIAICSGGNPGMAAAGMGDVLTGVIGALAAQGLQPQAAAECGAALHAAAGDAAATEGERGMVASDLIAALRGLVN